MAESRLDRLAARGQSVWFDTLSRELVRSGDELVVTVGPSRLVLALPSALRRCTVVGAALLDGQLRVRFEPDPSLWMGL